MKRKFPIIPWDLVLDYRRKIMKDCKKSDIMKKEIKMVMLLALTIQRL
jgi:hypothetical protein